MAQVTIYLEDALADEMRKAATSAKLSHSKWIAQLIRDKVQHQWSADVRDLAGAWQDFPLAEELRAQQVISARESL